MKPVPSCAAGSDAVAGQTRQALTEVNRSKARKSAAVLGLAISMGASHLLVPQQADATVSKHLPATDLGNWMPASPQADSSLDLDPADRGLNNDSDIFSDISSDSSPSATPVSAVNQLQQKIGNVSEPDDSNTVDLTVGAIDSNADTKLSQPSYQPSYENSSSVEAAAPSEMDIGEPQPSFLVTPISSHPPEFLFSGKPIQSTSLEVSLPATDEPASEGVLFANQGSAETIHKTITPGSAIYSAVESAGANIPENRMDPSISLETSPEHPATLEAGITPELEVPPIKIEYPNSIPVPAISFETEEIEAEAISEATVDPTTELNPSTSSSEAADARELNSETTTEQSIPTKSEEFQVSETDLPVESSPNLYPNSQVVVSPDLTNVVVIDSATPVASASRIYQVGFGETLDAIAQKNNVSVSDLVAVNQISDPNFIKAKQKIKVPLIEEPNPITQLGSDRQTAESSLDRGIDRISVALTTSENDPLVLGTDAIYPLAPRSRTKASAAPVDSRGQANDIPSKTPDFNNSLKADLAKLREKYPISQLENSYQAELPFDAGQSSSQVVVRVPDLPVATGQPTRSGIEVAQASQDVVSENAREIPQGRNNGYVQELISDIERLRQNHRNHRNQEAAFDSLANQNNGVGEFNPIAPEQSSRESNQVLQAAIENKPEKGQRPGTPSPENAKDPREQEATSEDLLATGSSGTAAYQPLLQPTTGQMVSPQLPPLNGPENYLPNSPAIFNGYIWPAQGVLTSGYGWRWGRMHNGIDIAGPVGTPIFAAAAGVVTYAGWNSGGYGNLVEIEHADGSFTVYAHNHRNLVREGQEVDQGEQVAEMGSTGFSTGPHLHFEIHPPGQGAVNPMAYLPRER